jgi:hypothetical protein
MHLLAGVIRPRRVKFFSMETPSTLDWQSAGALL